MAGPGGSEVGRLKVRVLPDTSNFAQSLQRYLDRIEARSRIQINVDADTSGVSSHVNALIQELSRREINLRVDVDRSRMPDTSSLLRDMDRLGRSGETASKGLASVAGALGRVGSMASALPSVAALAESLVSMAPAAAVAVPALLSLALAGGALKVGMSGVGDAMGGSADAMAKLTPAAQSFVKSVRGMKTEWAALQKSVQSKLFAGLGAQLSSTAKVVLPALRAGLTGAATALNQMGKGVLTTAKNLGASGALGTAMKGANTGLSNMSKIPGQLLNAFVKLGAAAAPAFDRITTGVANAMTTVSEKLNSGFKSGGLQKAISGAVDLVGQLGQILGNVGTILGNVFSAASAAGAGFFGVLLTVTGQLAKLSSSAAFASTLATVFQTLQSVGAAMGSVISAALRAIMPLIQTVVSTVGPAIQKLLAIVGPALSKLVTTLGVALGPIVQVLAQALAALLPILAQVISMVAGTLGPIFAALGPVIAGVASIIMSLLKPVLAAIPALLAPILNGIKTMLPVILLLGQQLLAMLAPAFKQLGTALGELVTAIAPVVSALMDGLMATFTALLPVISAIMPIVAKIASFLVSVLAAQITAVVVPAIKALAALMRGDFGSAAAFVGQMCKGMASIIFMVFAKITSVISSAISRVLAFIARMRAQAISYVASMAAGLVARAASGMARMASAISSGVSRAVSFVRSLPGRARSAMGNLGSMLYSSGAALLRGFINGIKSMVGKVASAVKGVVSKARDFFPFSPAKTGPFSGKGWTLYSGKSVSEAFAKGVTSHSGMVKRATAGLAGIAQANLSLSPIASPAVDGPTGLQAGDRLVLSLDGEREFETFVRSGARSEISSNLIRPASRGRAR